MGVVNLLQVTDIVGCTITCWSAGLLQFSALFCDNILIFDLLSLFG